jgi:hypothetical protein
MNPQRGDVSMLIDGETRKLRLTFGALAEIEAALEAADLAELGARLARLSATEMMLVLRSLLNGAGEDEAAEAIAEARVDLRATSTAIARAFREALE